MRPCDAPTSHSFLTAAIAAGNSISPAGQKANAYAGHSIEPDSGPSHVGRQQDKIDGAAVGAHAVKWGQYTFSAAQTRTARRRKMYTVPVSYDGGAKAAFDLPVLALRLSGRGDRVNKRSGKETVTWDSHLGQSLGTGISDCPKPKR